MQLKELLSKIEDELKLRNYSRKTIKSYLVCLADYFKYIKNVTKTPDVPLIKKYLLEKQDKGQSSQTINLYLNAIKYFLPGNLQEQHSYQHKICQDLQ